MQCPKIKISLKAFTYECNSVVLQPSISCKGSLISTIKFMAIKRGVGEGGKNVMKQKQPHSSKFMRQNVVYYVCSVYSVSFCVMNAILMHKTK